MGPVLDASEMISDAAISIYNGVLYKALDWQTLSPTAQRRGEASIRIISALFGVVTPGDQIFGYKSKIKGSRWKSEISKILDNRKDELIIDCRSSTYLGVWTPPHHRTVEIRVFQVANSERTVITHMSKKYRGDFARAVLNLKREPGSVAELVEQMQEHFNFDFTEATENEPHHLNLLIEIG